MKCKKDKLILRCILTSILCIVKSPALAIISDIKQPIHIESYMQSLDIEENIITFTGNVVVTQGTLKINADKVIITRPLGEKDKEVIDGYGHPVTFFQIQDNGKPIRGHAYKMRYELANDCVVLTSDAYLEQLDSSITGDKITYLVKEKKMQAYSKKGKSVTTVLLPSPLQYK